ncbi:hypothetical protein AZE42_05050 [Rhizopogon vesiculosus]|uniref:STAS domain-containing protein n=1 Tax=Rhizopogon vesiculosus TaxID=180088 RepID=A0A1J8PHM6_9AGAM|nr:hypothetical protein AZE42_05050 [Rhizopogon vesiculosus]
MSSVAGDGNHRPTSSRSPNNDITPEHANNVTKHDIPRILSPPPDDSPLHRAGLLQPRSYVSTTSVTPHSQDDIRASTVQLSMRLFPASRGSYSPVTLDFTSTVEHGARSSSSLTHGRKQVQEPLSPSGLTRERIPSRDSFIFPSGYNPAPQVDPGSFQNIPSSASFEPSSHFTKGLSAQSSDLSASTSTLDSSNTVQNLSSGISTPRGRDMSHPTTTPSALSILLSRYADGASPKGPYPQTPTLTPKHKLPPGFVPLPSTVNQNTSTQSEVAYIVSSPVTETTPLLLPPNGSVATMNGHPSAPSKHPKLPSKRLSTLMRGLIGESHKLCPQELGYSILKSLPAVLLGTLLNILDGVSYGMIIFPAFGVFDGLGGMGVSMFFVSTLVAQLVYCLGGSSFAGANGSMMIEVVPFFHILATTIARDIGEEYPKEIIATTIVSFALSSVLTGRSRVDFGCQVFTHTCDCAGLTFFLLGYLRLGVLIGFFPRHILVGCIGGVGIFLILTGLTVSTRLPSDALDPPTLETLRYFVLNPHALAQWVPPAVLAVLLRLITMRWKHQLVFPIYFMIIPAVFYVVVAAAQLDLNALRKDGWLFNSTEGAGGVEDKWYGFYSYLGEEVPSIEDEHMAHSIFTRADFGLIQFTPIWTTLPIQFALLFFNILHPPLNVPALSVSLDEDIDTNKELVGHGYSNLLAGFLGTVPNYLVYVNTLLFYRVGGGTRLAGFLLAVATSILLIIGTGPIAYIPVMVVSALIFVLGFDLVKEALWDTRHRVSRMEYITIISIMVTMTAWDFVIGVLFGIVVSCFFFVIQNSQRRSIRALYTGDSAISTVRRPAAHRAYIREVSKQTSVLRLQGFLFFGTISHVEETLRNIVNGPDWQHNPVRFVVVDLSLVVGVDMSAAEAFVRVQRLLAAKGVVLVFCGVTADNPSGKALSSVGVLHEPYVEVFKTLNDAMEWTENAYLRAWFRAQKSCSTPIALPGRQDTGLTFGESLTGSPRQMQLRDVGDRTIAGEFLDKDSEISSEPFNTLLNAFSSFHDIDQDTFRQIAKYFERFAVPEGFVLWENKDTPDGLYIIESGILRASYKFAEHSPVIEESMVSGTLAGELSALSGMPRNARVIVERQAVLWKLSSENLRRLETEKPRLAQIFVQLVLKAAKVDADILLAALATR